MNFSSKGNTYLFIFFYSFTIENMFKYQRDYNYTSSILSSFFSILDSSIHKEIFEPNRKANKQKKKGGAFRLRVCAQWRGGDGARPQIFFNGAWPRYSRSGDTCQIIERFPRYYRKRSDVLLYIATRVARDPMIDRYGGAISISRVIRQDKGIHCEGSDRHRGG